MKKSQSLYLTLLALLFLPTGTFALTQAISVNNYGIIGNGVSYATAITPDGRYVLFQSDADTLPNHSIGQTDVFIRDTLSGSTTLVSVNSSGDVANAPSQPVGITPDGRYVLFQSNASDLFPNDTNGVTDVFIRDTLSGATTLVSVNSSGDVANALSQPVGITSDGKYVFFESTADNLVPNDTNGVMDIFVRDLIHGTTTLVSVDDSGNIPNNGGSYAYIITPDGRYVLFRSDASNLVANDTNGVTDVFVRDLISGTTILVSINNTGDMGDSGSYPVSITPDGKYVTFYSYASNLVADDTNGMPDAFVRDTLSHTTSLISVDNSGTIGNAESYPVSITPDGRYILFYSYADNLANEQNSLSDVFVRDTLSGTTTLVSVNSSGDFGNGVSQGYGISDNGRYVLFQSDSDNLVVNQNIGYQSIYVRDLVNNTTTIVNVSNNNDFGNNSANPIGLTPDGKYILFNSNADNLVPNDTNGVTDVFLYTKTELPPVIVAPTSGDVITNSIFTVQGNGVSGNQLQLTVSGVSYNTTVDSAGNWSVVLPSLVDNIYVLQAKQKQPTDTIRSTITTSTITVDTMSPAPKVLTPTSGEVMQQPYISGTGEAGGNIQVTLSGHTNYTLTGIIDSQGIWTLSLKDIENGPYTITARQTDILGHVSVWSSPIYFYRYIRGAMIPISVNNSGSLGNQWSQSYDTYSTTPDGRYVVFYSVADDLVDAIQPGGPHLPSGPYVFVRDTVLGITRLVSQSTSGDVSNGYSQSIGITPDGRYVLFRSDSDNLVSNDTNEQNDIFVRDVIGGTTRLVSMNSSGNIGNNYSYPTAIISADGRYVVFSSDANNLVPNDTNGQTDIFVRDMLAGTTTLVSQSTSGDQTNGQSSINYVKDMTPDGRYVVFSSDANNLVPNDTNGSPDVFLRDIVAGTTTAISVDNTGNIINGTSRERGISADGKYILFRGNVSGGGPGDPYGYEQLYIRDTVNNTTNLVSISNNGDVGNNTSESWTMTSDGRYVVFSSDADNLVPDDTNGEYDTFIRDTVLGTTTIISVDNNGNIGNGYSEAWGGVSSDGRYVVFYSYADNLVPDDTNGEYDTFLRDTVAGTTKLISKGFDDNIGSNRSYATAISSDGRYITIDSNANNLVPDDTNGTYDVFMYDTQAGIGNNIPTVLTPTNGSIQSGGVIISGTGDRGFTVNLTLSGSTYSAYVNVNGVWSLGPLNLRNGEYTLTAQQVDPLGVTGSSVTRTFTVTVPNFGGGASGSPSAPRTTPSTPSTPSSIIKVATPQELADRLTQLSNRPVLGIAKTITIIPTTQKEAMKQAVVQTLGVKGGSTISVNTVVNPALDSTGKCYTPKEIVDITLGKNTTQKDLLVYQALLQSYDLTMFTDTDKYRPDSTLKRNEAAKMFVNFAKHVLCRESKATYDNQYTDIDNSDPTLIPYIKAAYEYGILKGGNGVFRPNDTISRTEFIAALIRMFTNQYLEEANQDWFTNYNTAFTTYGLNTIVGEGEDVTRYAMSKILYKLYYNPTYEFTDKGFVLPYGK